MKTNSYRSPSGETVSDETYRRWIEIGAAAYHANDRAFNHGAGADNPEDQQDQIGDLLCALRHFAQVAGLSFEQAIHSSAMHYEAEQRPDPIPAWAQAIAVLNSPAPRDRYLYGGQPYEQVEGQGEGDCIVLEHLITGARITVDVCTGHATGAPSDRVLLQIGPDGDRKDFPAKIRRQLAKQ